MKKILMLAMIAGLFCACNTQPQSSESEAHAVSIAEVVTQPLEYDEKEVELTGIITHICRGSGAKMRVNQLDDADFSIMVMLHDYQNRFSIESEGEQVTLRGVLKTHVRKAAPVSCNHDHSGDDHAHECASTQQAIKRLEEKGIQPNVVAYIDMTQLID